MNTYLVQMIESVSTGAFRNISGVIVKKEEFEMNETNVVDFVTEHLRDCVGLYHHEVGRKFKFYITCLETNEKISCICSDDAESYVSELEVVRRPKINKTGKLKAIGVNKLNVTLVENVIENNGHHRYVIKNRFDESSLLEVNYQNGPRFEKGSIPGVLDEDLLYMIRDRLETFQNSEFACHENEMALCKVEEAIMWLNKRTNDREKRGVLGTYNK